MKIVEGNNTFDTNKKFVTYEIADGWTALTGVDGVYYRAVDPKDSNQEFAVLNGDKVVCNSNADSDDLEAAETNKPTLAFTAYAIQKAGFTDEVAAWNASGFGG